MRLKINFEGSNTVYKNNCLPQVKGWFEDNVIGRNNNTHDEASDYCLSPMFGGVRQKNTEIFPNGGYVYFTTSSIELIGKVSMGLFNANGSAVGDLHFKSFEMVKDFHIHSDYDIIRTLSPLLLRSSHKNITINDNIFLSLLIDRCVKKLIKYGIPENKAKTLKIEFFHPERATVIDMQYNTVHNLATKAMFIVRGNKEAREMLYSLGFGSSTGCGFGTISVND